MGKRRCPQMCPFRQRAAPFCGFCMEKILRERTVQKKKKVKEGDADGQESETEDIRKAP